MLRPDEIVVLSKEESVALRKAIEFLYLSSKGKRDRCLGTDFYRLLGELQVDEFYNGVHEMERKDREVPA